MKAIDLSKGEHSLAEILTLAKSGTVLIHAASGEAFLVEQADEFDREAVALGSSDKFMGLLKSRSNETEEISIDAAHKKRGL